MPDTVGASSASGTVAIPIVVVAGADTSPSEFFRVTDTGTAVPASTPGTSTLVEPGSASTVTEPTVTEVLPQPWPPELPSFQDTLTVACEGSVPSLTG